MLFLSIIATASLAGCAAAQVQFLGVAIAGGDFGCQIDGTCPLGSTQLPLGSNGGGGDGAGQMKHWASLSKPLNMFRLPVSWQFLANDQVDGTLDSTKVAKYDQLVQSCLQTGAYCMIDIHNFARVDNAIIGQGGPTDDAFVSLWTQLATKYAAEENIVFELMNEPHDLDINVWAATCQKAVTGIRNAGAASQMILLPGTNFDSAATLVSSGSAAAMMNITNPDGSTDNLLLDIHKYLDEDNSGTHTTCTTNNIDAFTTVSQFLRQAGRKGFISESGASGDATCITNFCAQNTFINQNADVFAGLVGWGAGSFDTSYILSLTPSTQNNQLVDNTLMQQCMLDVWANTVSTGAAAAVPVASGSAAAPATTVPTAALLTAPANTGRPSTIYITPVVTTTLVPLLSAASATTTGRPGTSTLNMETLSEELGAGETVAPLLTASATVASGGLARTTQPVVANVSGTVADSLWIATASQDLTSAATIGATAIVTASGAKALERGSSWAVMAVTGMVAPLIVFL